MLLGLDESLTFTKSGCKPGKDSVDIDHRRGLVYLRGRLVVDYQGQRIPTYYDAEAAAEALGRPEEDLKRAFDQLAIQNA